MVEVTNVVKRYGATSVLNRATFRIAEGQLTTILGPSGCGKSTMLRCLNRLERFDEGHIRIGDIELHGTAHEKLSTRAENDLVNRVRMRVGLVFQNFNLFPHLSALENVIEAPITVKKLRRSQAEDIGRLYLNLVGLSGKEDEYPARLSGGQQQRVAIARALSMEPDIVLFDEPTSALDPLFARELGTLLRLLDDLKRTLIVVSHDMDFAQAISDQVIPSARHNIQEVFRVLRAFVFDLFPDQPHCCRPSAGLRAAMSVVEWSRLMIPPIARVARYRLIYVIRTKGRCRDVPSNAPLTRVAEYLEHRWRPVTRA